MHNDFTFGYGSSLRPDWLPYCRVWSDWAQVGVRWLFLSCIFICDPCQLRSASKAGTWPLFEVPSLPNGANNIPGSEGFPKGEIIISCVNTGIKDQVMSIILLCNYIAKIWVLLGKLASSSLFREKLLFLKVNFVRHSTEKEKFGCGAWQLPGTPENRSAAPARNAELRLNGKSTSPSSVHYGKLQVLELLKRVWERLLEVESCNTNKSAFSRPLLHIARSSLDETVGSPLASLTGNFLRERKGISGIPERWGTADGEVGVGGWVSVP